MGLHGLEPDCDKVVALYDPARRIQQHAVLYDEGDIGSDVEYLRAFHCLRNSHRLSSRIGRASTRGSVRICKNGQWCAAREVTDRVRRSGMCRLLRDDVLFWG